LRASRPEPMFSDCEVLVVALILETCFINHVLNCCRRSSISTRTRRYTSPGTTPQPTKMTRLRPSSVGLLDGWCSCTCRLTAPGLTRRKCSGALSPGSHPLRAVREHQGGHRCNAEFLPALQRPAAPCALHHRLQCRMIFLTVLSAGIGRKSTHIVTRQHEQRETRPDATKLAG
jgi:hypothetical protein